MHENSLPTGDRMDMDKESTETIFIKNQILQETTNIPSPRAVWQNADNHGWHDPSCDLNTDLLLIHSEISEACEGARNGKMTSKDGPGSVGEELADAVIRIFHTAEKNNINITAEIHRKHRLNMSRPVRHGGKAF